MCAGMQGVVKPESTMSWVGSAGTGAPRGNRTPVSTLKGWRPGPLDDGGNRTQYRGILRWWANLSPADSGAAGRFTPTPEHLHAMLSWRWRGSQGSRVAGGEFPP